MVATNHTVIKSRIIQTINTFTAIFIPPENRRETIIAGR
jgi:hypothetical protein